MSEFLLNYNYGIKLQTATTPSIVMSTIAAGITDIDLQNNEQLAQDTYLDGDGFGTTDVIGAQFILTCTGHRVYGDAAQDFIFGKLFDLSDRRSTAEITLPNGDTIEGNVTIANISGPGGTAGAKGDISFELHFNGEPTLTAAV